ncbi:MAG: hypothetical protein LJE68_04010 [Rhodobacter sp.]|jgi:hypothetical protein|nr:hypothetical protein [Rhodobacter sp.]
MFRPFHLKVASLALIVAATASCQVDGPRIGASVTARAGFKANYLVARAALENGQFTKAERGYAGLLKKAGPLEPRLRLEYAHALLRAGKYAKASDEARVVASQLQGRGRSAALAVQATADQEIARGAINKGLADADAIQRLVAARAGFDEMLKNHPDLDPLGALALRRKTIDVELSTIN